MKKLAPIFMILALAGCGGSDEPISADGKTNAQIHASIGCAEGVGFFDRAIAGGSLSASKRKENTDCLALRIYEMQQEIEELKKRMTILENAQSI